LIKVKGEPKVIEYNVRMGDPETEVVIPRIKNDFIDLLKSAAKKELNKVKLEVNSDTATTVMVVSGGYPESYEKGKEIHGLENVKESIVFHAGTDMSLNKVITSGGRVLAFTSFGKDKNEAVKKSYESIGKICFDKMYFRKDIGFDL
jgi:phosphoribosylamine--glycine ligase